MNPDLKTNIGFEVFFSTRHLFLKLSFYFVDNKLLFRYFRFNYKEGFNDVSFLILKSNQTSPSVIKIPILFNANRHFINSKDLSFDGLTDICE